MTRITSPLVALAALFVSAVALASQEGALALGSFRMDSPGIGESGPVIVEGRQDATGMKVLRIEAFGKRFELSPDQLRTLKAGMLNGLQLSYEAGYRETGGRTVYLVFSQSFTSGVVARRFVTVTESGSVKVGATP